MRPFIILIVVAAAGIVGWLYWDQNRPRALVVSGFIEADAIRVGSRVGGRVSELLTAEGRTVKRGEPLFRIDPFDLRERLAQARAELAAHQAEHARLKAGFRREEIEQAQARRDQAAATLDRLVAGPRPQEIGIAREELKRAQADLAYAQTEHERISGLAKTGDARPTEVEQVERLLKSAQAANEAAAQQVALLEEGTRKEEIAAARAALAEAQAALKLTEAGYRDEDIARAAAQAEAAAANVAAIEVQMRELEVVSPCDCVVEAVDLNPGDFVARDAPSITLLDPSRLWVRAYVPENRLAQAQLERRVPVGVDSVPDRRFAGRLTFVAREAEFTPRNVQTPEERSKQVFRIKVTLEEGHDVLRVGMAADVYLDEQM